MWDSVFSLASNGRQPEAMSDLEALRTRNPAGIVPWLAGTGSAPTLPPEVSPPPSRPKFARRETEDPPWAAHDSVNSGAAVARPRPHDPAVGTARSHGTLPALPDPSRPFPPLLAAEPAPPSEPPPRGGAAPPAPTNSSAGRRGAQPISARVGSAGRGCGRERRRRSGLSPARGSGRAAAAGALRPRSPELRAEERGALRNPGAAAADPPEALLSPALVAPRASDTAQVTEVSGERCCLIPALTGTIKRKKSKLNKTTQNVVKFNKTKLNAGGN